MSAFVVDREHIRYLVNAGQTVARRNGPPFSWVWKLDREAGTYERSELHRHGAESQADAIRVGQMLWDENIKSVCARYPDCAENHQANMPGPCDESYLYDEHHIDTLPIDWAQVIMSCHCYDYQACEHDGWPESEAKAFVESLAASAGMKLADAAGAVWGAPKPLHPDPNEVARVDAYYREHPEVERAEA